MTKEEYLKTVQVVVDIKKLLLIFLCVVGYIVKSLK